MIFLVYLSKPSNSFSELMNLLETFGRYVGYKLNVQKTLILTFIHLQNTLERNSTLGSELIEIFRNILTEKNPNTGRDKLWPPLNKN